MMKSEWHFTVGDLLKPSKRDKNLEIAAKLGGATWCVCSLQYGLTYQSCRFCKVSWPKVSGLYKYGVRHYICEHCRRRKLAETGIYKQAV